MPLIEFICRKCGYRSEELVKVGQQPTCPKCGEKMSQDYNGTLTVNSVKPQHCTGNCKTCKGCK